MEQPKQWQQDLAYIYQVSRKAQGFGIDADVHQQVAKLVQQLESYIAELEKRPELKQEEEVKDE